MILISRVKLSSVVAVVSVNEWHNSANTIFYNLADINRIKLASRSKLMYKTFNIHRIIDFSILQFQKIQ